MFSRARRDNAEAFAAIIDRIEAVMESSGMRAKVEAKMAEGKAKLDAAGGAEWILEQQMVKGSSGASLLRHHETMKSWLGRPEACT